MKTDVSPTSIETRPIQNRISARQEPSAFNFVRNRKDNDLAHVVPFERRQIGKIAAIVANEEQLPEQPVETLSFNLRDGLSRLRDIAGSCVLLLFLSPVLVLVAIAIKLSDGGPFLYKQRRVGRFGEEFDCYKFRTMLVDSEVRLKKLLNENPGARLEWESCQKLAQDPRITFLGTFLRFSSIDELPQLWNVLRGDMSLVGPRPVVAAELKKYGHYSSYYKRVLPGLTGLWQVSGRSETTYRRRIALDVAYVKNKSFLLDLRILFATIPEVLKARGAY